jgi:TonB family protein
VPLIMMLLAIQASAAAPPRATPIGSPASWVTDADYPMEALLKQQQGMVTYQLQIDAQGRPGWCRVVQSSGSESLDAVTCALVRARARFRPARDSKGRPVPSDYQSRLRWVLPVPDPETFRPGISIATIDLAPSGAVKNCAVTKEGADVDYFVQWNCQSILTRDLRDLPGGVVPGARRLRFIISQSYAGQTFAIDRRASWGLAVSEEAAEFEIDNDGKPQNCRRIRPPNAAEGILCGLIPIFHPRYTVPSEAGRRNFVIESALYAETGEPPAVSQDAETTGAPPASPMREEGGARPDR